MQQNRIIYGKVSGLGFKVHTLDAKGIPRDSGEVIHYNPRDLRTTAWWRGGCVGVAEATFPDPQRWRLADIDKSLDKIGVRDMTRAFARKEARPPNCKRKWEELLGEISWSSIGNRYKQGLVTPADFGTHYKCITHRQFKLRRGEGGDRCRLCGAEKESVQHFGECRGLKPIFDSMRKVDGGHRWNDSALNLLGAKEGKAVERGTSALHMMIWKQVIPEMVRVDTKNEKFQSEEVLKRAVRRYKKRERALEVSIKLYKNKCESKGMMPSMDRFNKALAGIAEVDDSGKVSRKRGLEEWIEAHGAKEEDEESGEKEGGSPQQERKRTQGTERTATPDLYTHFVRGKDTKRQKNIST